MDVTGHLDTMKGKLYVGGTRAWINLCFVLVSLDACLQQDGVRYTADRLVLILFFTIFPPSLFPPNKYYLSS